MLYRIQCQTAGPGVGKGDGHVDSDFPLVSKVKCAKFHAAMRTVSAMVVIDSLDSLFSFYIIAMHSNVNKKNSYVHFRS